MRLSLRYALGGAGVALATCLALGGVLLALTVREIDRDYDREASVVLRLGEAAVDANPQRLVDRIVRPGSPFLAAAVYDRATGRRYVRALPGEARSLPSFTAAAAASDADSVEHPKGRRVVMTGSFTRGGPAFAAVISGEPRRSTVRHAVLVGLLVVGGLGLLAALATAAAARRIGGPLIALSGAAHDLGRGEFDPGPLARVTRRRDEVGELARRFAAMAREIQDRERALASRVAALEVQIDETQRRRSVEEITATPSFASLASRAQRLRERRTRLEEGGATA